MSYKKFVDFDEGLDIPVDPKNSLSTEWTSRRQQAGYDDPEKFREYLSRNMSIFDITRSLLEQRYKTAQNASIDFSKPNVEYSLWYYEGYKQAIRDIHKLLPRPKGD